MKNNHINQSGDLHMIDISEKEITLRTAKASGEIVLNKQAFHWKMHKRLKVTLISPLGDAIEDLDHYALNLSLIHI